LQRLLSSQMFYFSSLQSYDLTRSAQHRDSHDGSDARFFWNRSLHFSFQRYGIDTDNWLLKCMAGSVLVRVVYVGANTGRVVKNQTTKQDIFINFRHLSQLKYRYGEFAIVNLLGRKEGERVLSEAFKTQHKNSHFAPLVEFIDFDYHAQMKISKEAITILKKKMAPHMNKHGFFYSMGKDIVKRQTGVIRTNCLDCLDRTNAVQLQSVFKCHMIRVEEILKDLWQKNGDQCSTIYAGTGALDGKSKLKDASRSLARTIQNNLMDGAKQESFDLFLTGAAYDPRLFDRACNVLPPSLIQEYADAVSQLVERSPEIAERQSIKIFVGTWNVNGGKNIHNVAFRNESSLSHWIFANSLTRLVSVEDEQLADIVAIGVEELVDLNASNMVKASTTNQRMWCESIRKTLAEKAPFVLIGSEQLVGVCLFLFARPRVSPYLKDFAVASVKTGMGGATGNKGSVAFRIVVYSTSICFICSHFAAGQNEIKDRNEDFATTLKKIRFPLGREIDSHDVIFWFGDFNYRISLSGEEVKAAVRNGDFSKLIEYDQLTQQKAQGKYVYRLQ
ncbi:hypothetical protein CAEBREN_31903, partial [Caenorhabditis brenneri]